MPVFGSALWFVFLTYRQWSGSLIPYLIPTDAGLYCQPFDPYVVGAAIFSLACHDSGSLPYAPPVPYFEVLVTTPDASEKPQGPTEYPPCDAHIKRHEGKETSYIVMFTPVTSCSPSWGSEELANKSAAVSLRDYACVKLSADPWPCNPIHVRR